VLFIVLSDNSTPKAFETSIPSFCAEIEGFLSVSNSIRYLISSVIFVGLPI